MNFMAEVDEEIAKILNKKPANNFDKNQFCDGSNIRECLEQLSQEFDYLDVNAIKDVGNLDSKRGIKTALIQVINSSYNLLQFQKETRKKLNENCDKNTSINGEVLYLRKMNDELKKDIKTKNDQIKLQNERKILDKIQSDEIKTKLANAKSQIDQLKKSEKSTINRHKIEIQKLVIENHGVDSSEKYKNQIQMLRQNNQQLLEEISELKYHYNRE